MCLSCDLANLILHHKARRMQKAHSPFRHIPAGVQRFVKLAPGMRAREEGDGSLLAVDYIPSDSYRLHFIHFSNEETSSYLRISYIKYFSS